MHDIYHGSAIVFFCIIVHDVKCLFISYQFYAGDVAGTCARMTDVLTAENDEI